MKTYTITVNGNVYQVTVEEGAAAPVQAAAPAVSAPIPQVTPVAPAAPAAAPAPAPAPSASPAGSVGGVEITASVPGKICKVEAAVGQAVKAGDPVVILEAMKMEIPVVAPQDGTIASINVSAGAAVESGDVLATMN